MAVGGIREFEEEFRRHPWASMVGINGTHYLPLAFANDRFAWRANIEALRFYQRRGFRMVRILRDSISALRLLKPSIPMIGDHGIELKDEVELERVF